MTSARCSSLSSHCGVQGHELDSERSYLDFLLASFLGFSLRTNGVHTKWGKAWEALSDDVT